MESRGDQLLPGRLRKQVPGKLFDDEPVEWQIAVERPNDPVTIHPNVARSVSVVAVGIRVARKVQPVPAPTLAVARRGKQALDQPLVSIRAPVVDELANLLGRREQARKIELHTTR